MQPGLDEVQQSLNNAIRMILSVSKCKQGVRGMSVLSGVKPPWGFSKCELPRVTSQNLALRDVFTLPCVTFLTLTYVSSPKTCRLKVYLKLL